MNGPQLPFSASWKMITPASFDAAPLGTDPQGRRLFLTFALSYATLPKAGALLSSYLRCVLVSLCASTVLSTTPVGHSLNDALSVPVA